MGGKKRRNKKVTELTGKKETEIDREKGNRNRK
jgi:hypothetical protein